MNKKTLCNIFSISIFQLYGIFVRKNQRIGILKTRIVKRISEHFRFMKLLPNINLDNILEEISRLDIDNLVNI